VKRNASVYTWAISIAAWMFICTSLSLGTTAHAQTPDATRSPAPSATATQTPTTSPSPAQSPDVSPGSNVEVTDVYRLGHSSESDKDRNRAGIGDIIVIKVRDLITLVNQAKCLDKSGKKVPDCRDQQIALFLDGRKINGIVPESGAPRPEDETLQFHLQRNLDNDEAWADLLGAPLLGSGFFRRPTEVSVGLESGYPEPTIVKAQNFSLTRIREIRFWVCTIGVLLLLYLILRLAKRSDILRDSGPAPTGNDARGKEKRKPFSLARCQMAFWFFWVIASFLYIWQITGAYDIITASVLGLIGIGAGTALGAAVIDVGKREDTTSQLASLEAEKTTLTSDIASLDSQIKASPPPANLSELQQTKGTKETRLNLVNAQITDLKAAASAQESQGFVKDILTDATGVTFHRFQMAVWTIVLGFIFIYSVWSRLSMPEFSATLLALLGISAGTYIGFKIPEQQQTQSQ